jgi:two-component system OmpR family response regulator
MSTQKPTILLAEDDANFSMMLKVFLEMNGYEVDLFTDGKAALEALDSKTFSLGIFDVMMPIMDGYTLAEKVAQLKPDMPFIFLTAKAQKDDQITGYKVGARDYLVKPFDPEILLLKIQVILRSQEKTNADQHIFNIGNFVFDASRRLLTLGEKTEKLSPKEAALLKLLSEKKGELLPHSEAMLKIWKNDDYFTKQSMNVFISKLRKYLSKDTTHRIEIENLHSTGFVLVVEKV